MATVTVYDLDLFPDSSKTITVQLKSVVTVGTEGDEEWAVSSDTTAYSDTTLRTPIQDLYVRDIKAGWLNSSGLVGTGGKFTVGSTSKTLGVKLDGSANTYYIVLEEGTNLTGDSVADDIETKIRALPEAAQWNSADNGYRLAYMNATVTFENNKFKIVSGTMSQYYTGSNRTSVSVTASGVDTAYSLLGFNLGISSEQMAGISLKESLVTSGYTTNTTPLTIGDGTGVVEGDALYITDGTNYDYFTALSGTTDTSVVVATQGNNSYIGIKHSYDANVAKVQILSYGDSECVPTPAYTNIDQIVRFGIKSITNQIDFS